MLLEQLEGEPVLPRVWLGSELSVALLHTVPLPEELMLPVLEKRPEAEADAGLLPEVLPQKTPEEVGELEKEAEPEEPLLALED